MAYEGSVRRRIREWREKRPTRGQEDRDRLVFWLEKLLLQIIEAKRDEETAIRMYEKLNTDIAAVYPPGTLPYDRIKAIFDDENKHYSWLVEIQEIIEKRLRELRVG